MHNACPVLHIDVDTFFCQVEQNMHPGLKGRAFAIQQHQDIIAVNYAARAAGVKKHMNPKEARTLLSKVGGIVHHVHMEAGGRVSYKPYRDVSKVFISRLRQFAGVGIIEKASIDEAYILYKLEPQNRGHGTLTIMQQAEQLAQTIRQAVLQELSLVVSVGIGNNKMVAKLASQASKPNGILNIDGDAALQKLLSTTPASRLPRCGGKVTDTLTLAGVHTVADLQAWSPQQLQKDLGFAADQAKQLSEWSHGFDASPVAERPPPKTLSIQMTLTPIPLVMHPSMGRDIAVAGGKAGLLEPLPIGAANFRERLDGLLAAMSADILGRVMGDRAEEDRWPQKFELQMRAFKNSDRKSKTAVRSCSFPSPALLAPAESPESFNEETGAGSKLEAALIANAVKLSKNAAAGLPETWALVQVEFAATNFSSFSAAAAPSIHKFLQQATKSSTIQEQSQAAARSADITSTTDAAVKGIATHQEPHADVRPTDIASTANAAAKEQVQRHSQVLVSSTREPARGPQKLQVAMPSGRDGVQGERTAGVLNDWASAQPAKECNDQSNAEASEDYTCVDIEQQRQLLRDIQVRNNLLAVQSSSHTGSKRPHSSSNHKVAKQSKGEQTTGPGQRTITSLFAKGH